MPAVAVQIHEWPWSFGVPEETSACGNALLDVEYHGSPVLSAVEGASLHMEGRHEQFIASGPVFRSYSGELQLFHMPHGLLSPFGAQGSSSAARLLVSVRGELWKYDVRHTEDAVPLYIEEEGSRRDTELARMVLAWSNAFDDMLAAASEAGEQGDMPWQSVLDFIRHLRGGEDEPRMSLIVRIAVGMFDSLEHIVHGARRLLSRERRMLPAGRLNEFDHACIHWYIRQPGENAAQKAAANGQCLLGVARNETFDTLENRVLKDFLRRCVEQSRNYLQFDCTLRQRTDSSRGRKVRAFKVLCEHLYKAPHLEQVSPQKGFVRPNYVLQNDLRYKKIWEFYLRLLRQEDEEDKLWAWQNRTWNDIACLLLDGALYSVSRESRSPLISFEVRVLAQSSLFIQREQRLGCRLLPGTEPGPFFIFPGEGKEERGGILEIVHAEQMDMHARTQGLGRLGAWQYLVFSPLDAEKPVSVIAVWPVHTAASRKGVELEHIQISAENALSFHMHAVNERASRRMNLHGLVLCSSLDDGRFAAGGKVHAAVLKARPEHWSENVDTLALLLEDLLEKML